MKAVLAILWFIALYGSLFCVYQTVEKHPMVAYFAEGRLW